MGFDLHSPSSDSFQLIPLHSAHECGRQMRVARHDRAGCGRITKLVSHRPFGMKVVKMTLRQRSLAAASTVVAAVSIAFAGSPAATADPPGCVPLNGVQADSHGSSTSSIGIFYDLDVTYWYQDGAVNWHKDVNGPFGTHSNGAVPAAPGNTVTIPGNAGTPLLVTVCSK
jgi:hypothetical protein